MTFDNIQVEHDGEVLVVTVNRPKVLNALNSQTVDELRQAMTAAAGDETVRCIVLTGAGERAFVAGADINELAEQTPVGGSAHAQRGQALLDLIERLGKPVIAAINGYALGGGCELAMACTFRVASDAAKLGQPEINLGIMPGYGGSQRLPRLVGKGRAMQILLTGGMVKADEAYRIGLANEVVSQAELAGTVESLARKIIANAPLAVQFCLEAVNRGVEMTQSDGQFLEATLFGLCCATEDMKEGTKAFLEKRAADFKGK